MDFTVYVWWVNLRQDVILQCKKYYIYWYETNCYGKFFAGWLNGVICIHATCNSMGDLTKAKTNITCKSDEVIYVNEQSINFLGSDAQNSVINNNECKNSTSSKCFHKLAKDCSSYLNISTSCNGKDKCTLLYNDIYYSVITIPTFKTCDFRKDSDFYLLRIGVSYECFHCRYSLNSFHVYYFAALTKYPAFSIWFIISWKISIIKTRLEKIILKLVQVEWFNSIHITHIINEHVNTHPSTHIANKISEVQYTWRL